MSSAWLLPEHIADVLPARARQIESLRRGLLDAASGFGFELVIPPMLEHIESLLREARTRDAETDVLASTAEYAGDADPYVKPRDFDEDADDWHERDDEASDLADDAEAGGPR